ncbi:copper chaperone PCu(A)C [Streptomyces sp. NPDC058424]|uniref:copper chaperone PCu(A)C n=1 Tax=Streptomyces sp. NPDC058424 TaxID=3346491 RepID=UPI00364CE7F9
MSSSLRRGALAAAAIAFSIASLAACGAGNDAQTLQIRPDHAATTVGTIKVQNAVVVTQPGVQTKGPAVIIATLFNNGTTDQTLDGIRVDGDGSAQITPAQGGGKLTIPAHGSVILGGKGNASAALTNPGPVLKDGNAQKITFTFSKTGDVSLRAFVVPAQGYFDKWGPSNIPAAPGEPAASHSAAGEQSKSPAAQQSGSASASGGGAAAPGDSASQSTAGN